MYKTLVLTGAKRCVIPFLMCKVVFYKELIDYNILTTYSSETNFVIRLQYEMHGTDSSKFPTNCEIIQGRIQPEVEGGTILRGGAKKKMKSECAEGARKFFGLHSIKFSGLSSE